MARKRYNEEDILRLLREIEVHLHEGMDVVSACRTAGISDKTYYGWRKRYGGMGRAKLTEFKALEKENQRLKKILAELELDKLILKESLDYLSSPQIMYHFLIEFLELAVSCLGLGEGGCDCTALAMH